MLLHQLLDLGPAVIRRHFDPVIGVARIEKPRDSIQLGPLKVPYVGPLDARRNDGVVNLA
jgi:hypothetical protein